MRHDPPVANATGGYKYESPTDFGQIHVMVKCGSLSICPIVVGNPSSKMVY